MVYILNAYVYLSAEEHGSLFPLFRTNVSFFLFVVLFSPSPFHFNTQLCNNLSFSIIQSLLLHSS